MIQIPVWAVVILALLIVVVVIFATWAYLTAQRLHRIHKRVDQAAISLAGCLDRRAVAVRGVARSMRREANQMASTQPEKAAQIRADADALSDATEVAEDTDVYQPDALMQREDVENDITLLLRRTDFSFIGRDETEELQDAVLRVTLARRFYNSAVREAISLQSAPLVRFLHLAGRAPQPQFFNIVESTEPYSAENS